MINSLRNGLVSAPTAPDVHCPARVERCHPVRTMADATVAQTPPARVLADLVHMAFRVLDNVIAMEVIASTAQKETESALVTLFTRGEAAVVGSQRWVFSLVVWPLLFPISSITFGIHGKNITTLLSKT